MIHLNILSFKIWLYLQKFSFYFLLSYKTYCPRTQSNSATKIKLACYLVDFCSPCWGRPMRLSSSSLPSVFYFIFQGKELTNTRWGYQQCPFSLQENKKHNNDKDKRDSNIEQQKRKWRTLKSMSAEVILLLKKFKSQLLTIFSYLLTIFSERADTLFWTFVFS